MRRIKNLGGYITADKMQLVEIDYLARLTDADRAWLERFTENFYNARFIHDGHDKITSRCEQMALNRQKGRRRNDFNNIWPSVANINGAQILKPYDKPKPKQAKKSKKVKKFVPPMVGVPETVEQFLARGGKITKSAK